MKRFRTILSQQYMGELMLGEPPCSTRGNDFAAPWTKTTFVSAAVNFSREVGTMRKNPDLGKRRQREMNEWSRILRGRNTSPRQ